MHFTLRTSSSLLPVIRMKIALCNNNSYLTSRSLFTSTTPTTAIKVSILKKQRYTWFCTTTSTTTTIARTIIQWNHQQQQQQLHRHSCYHATTTTRTTTTTTVPLLYNNCNNNNIHQQQQHLYQPHLYQLYNQQQQRRTMMMVAKVRYNLKGLGSIHGTALKICFCYTDHDLYAKPKSRNHEQYQYVKCQYNYNHILQQAILEYYGTTDDSTSSSTNSSHTTDSNIDTDSNTTTTVQLPNTNSNNSNKTNSNNKNNNIQLEYYHNELQTWLPLTPSAMMGNNNKNNNTQTKKKKKKNQKKSTTNNTNTNIESSTTTSLSSTTTNNYLKSYKGGMKVLNLRIPSLYTTTIHERDVLDMITQEKQQQYTKMNHNSSTGSTSTNTIQENDINDTISINDILNIDIFHVITSLILTCKVLHIERSKIRPYHLIIPIQNSKEEQQQQQQSTKYKHNIVPPKISNNNINDTINNSKNTATIGTITKQLDPLSYQFRRGKYNNTYCTIVHYHTKEISTRDWILQLNDSTLQSILLNHIHILSHLIYWMHHDKIWKRIYHDPMNTTTTTTTTTTNDDDDTSAVTPKTERQIEVEERRQSYRVIHVEYGHIFRSFSVK